jgi:hypothetical protein
MKKLKNPLTVEERVKGHAIREKTGSDAGTRELKSSKAWRERNTHGNLIKKK